MLIAMYLDKPDLIATFYKKAAKMDQDDVDLYLQRANTFAAGIIGGTLPTDKIDIGLKTAVALAFEIFAKGETAQIDPVNGFMTEAAPAGFYANAFAKKPDPLATVREMIRPYGAYVIYEPPQQSDRGVRFL